MLIIRPVTDKKQQAEYAAVCGVPYCADDLAYAGYTEDVFVAFSQFRLHESGGVLDSLSLRHGSNDWEALFILARQTLNWIDLHGFHQCRCQTTAGNLQLLKLIGFNEQPDGSLLADMTHMFDGSCGGHCSIAEELKKL